jgi:hypothetical protein
MLTQEQTTTAFARLLQQAPIAHAHDRMGSLGFAFLFLDLGRGVPKPSAEPISMQQTIMLHVSRHVTC